MTASPLIETERHGRVGVVRLNRPQALNALSRELAEELVAAAQALEADSAIGAIVITGNGRAFAAGADIAEMQPLDANTARARALYQALNDGLVALEKPLIAAVNGFALGGGCELALMCDVLVASSKARFGQPEINLGVIPGIGGTQRLARFLGKPVTMDLCLTGRLIDAEEALRIGLVSRVLPHESFFEEVLALAREIAEKSLAATTLMTKVIDSAFETPLSEGIVAERQAFFSCFDSEDQKEGMAAFLEKRSARWRHR